MTPTTSEIDSAPVASESAADPLNLDDLWPWAPHGRQVPAMFADDEMLEILMPHGPRLAKGQASSGQLRRRIEHMPGAGNGPLVAQIGRLMSDPATRVALLESAGDIDGLGSYLMGAARVCIPELFGRPDPVVMGTRFPAILGELRKKAAASTTRDARRWHVCGTSATILLAATTKDDPISVLRDVATHWPELLPTLLPTGCNGVSSTAVLAAKAPQAPATSELTRLEARQVELAALTADLEKLIVDHQALEQQAQRPVAPAGRAAALRQQADAWDAWAATSTALGERVGKACPAAAIAGSDPAALLAKVKAAREDTAQKLADLHRTAEVAKRLLGLRSQPIHVPSPRVAEAVKEWLHAEIARAVDDTHPDHPVLRLAPDHERVRILNVLCNLIAEAPTMGVKSLVMNDLHIMAMAGAFYVAPAAPVAATTPSASAEELEDAQLENLRLQERVLELEGALKRKDWEITCLRQGGTPEQMKRPAERPAPRTVADAVEHAMADFGDTLVFLDSAHESAADSPFQNVGLVYKHLEGMAKLSALWRAAPEGKLNKGFKEAFRDLGLPDYRGQISDTASGKFGQEYLFLYKGQKLEFKEHFTLGSKDPNTCLSIHFLRDPDKRRLVVGHVGRHLSNTKS